MSDVYEIALLSVVLSCYRIVTHSWGKLGLNDHILLLHTCQGRQRYDLCTFVCRYFKGHGYWRVYKIGVPSQLRGLALQMPHERAAVI